MKELLTLLAEYIWFVDLFISTMFFILVIQAKRLSSSFITWLTVVLLGGAVIQLEAFAMSIQPPDTSAAVMFRWCVGFILLASLASFLLIKLIKPYRCRLPAAAYFGLLSLAGLLLLLTGYEQVSYLFTTMPELVYKNWVRTVHYLGQFSLNILAVYILYSGHRALWLKFDFVAKLSLMALIVSSIFQFTRFIERITFDTHYLAEIYKWGMVSVNVCVSMSVLVYCCNKLHDSYSQLAVNKAKES